MSEDVIIRFLKKKGIETNCCISCHEDVDYGYDLLEIYLRKRQFVRVCCAVKTAWEKLLKQKPEYEKLEEDWW